MTEIPTDKSWLLSTVLSMELVLLLAGERRGPQERET